MNRYRWGTVIILLMAWCAACAPRQVRQVAEIDPGPFLEAVQARRTALEQGLSGSLDLAYKNRKHRFNSKAYVVVYPDGRFRMEVAGPLGGTQLVLTNDNTEILAYYPDDNRAFRSDVSGRSLGPHLPFPLPVDPAILPALIMGVPPESDHSSGARAYLLDSGERVLGTGPGNAGLQFTYLFDKSPEVSLRKIQIQGLDLEVTINTGPEPDHRLRDFSLHLQDGTLKGEWDAVSLFKGDGADLLLRLPPSVPVIDLEASP